MRRWVAGLSALALANSAIAAETITYTYDANGRLVQAAHSGSVNNGVTTTYTLDKADNRTQVVTGSGGGSPDLTGTAGPTPATATVGVPTTVQGVVSNVGPGSAGASTTLFQFLDANLNCTQPNFCGSTQPATPAIGANSSSNVSTTYTFPVAGTYAVRFCADINSQVAESNENNNCSPITYVVAGSASAPDLQVTSAPTPTSVTVGTATTVQATVQNTGNGNAGSFTSFFQFLDASHNCTNPNFCGSITTSAITLAAGASATLSGSYTYPVAGTYGVRACADGGGTVAESNENNNCGPWSTVTAASTPTVTANNDALGVTVYFYTGAGTFYGYNCVTVTANDSSSAGYTLSVSSFTQGGSGSVTASGTTALCYTTYSYGGTDSFNYTVSDGHGHSATATVNVTDTYGGTM